MGNDDNQTTTDPWGCEEEFADAPFCKGDSVIECWDKSQVPQGELCPPNPCEAEGTCDHTDPVGDTHVREGYQSRLTEPFVSAFEDCGPDGAYLDIATSVGSYELAIDGEAVTNWTVSADEVSELGLVARGQSVDNTASTVTITGTIGEHTTTDEFGYDAPCGPETSEQAASQEQVTTAPEPEELPVTGPVTDVFLLGALGVSLLASGIATLRRT